MAPKTNPENCVPGHCDDHSGLLVWMKAATGLCTLAVGLLTYSVLWQAPSIRMDVAREIARLDMRDKDTGFDIETIKKDITDHNRRLSLLEEKDPS